MTRIVPLTVVAGALSCFLIAGSAQAAPATTGILGKLATASNSTQIEKAGWRHRHGHHSCFRRCMWRTDGAYRFCRRKCHRWGW
jgi:hypothetical protein